MNKPASLFVLAGALLIASSISETNINSLVVNGEREKREQKTYFTENDTLGIRIPKIGLETKLNFAPVIGNQIGRDALKGHPAWISPEADPGLCRIGEVGVSLILGHRQWGMRPLVFARLDELQRGDIVTVFSHTSGSRFTVYGKAEITPGRIWEVVDREDGVASRGGRSVVIMVTCAPYGRNSHRLLVFAGRKAGVMDELSGGGGNPGAQ